MSNTFNKQDLQEIIDGGIQVYSYDFIKMIPGEDVEFTLDKEISWIICEIKNGGQFNLIKEKLKYSGIKHNFEDYNEEFPSILFNNITQECFRCRQISEGNFEVLINDNILQFTLNLSLRKNKLSD